MKKSRTDKATALLARFSQQYTAKAKPPASKDSKDGEQQPASALHAVAAALLPPAPANAAQSSGAVKSSSKEQGGSGGTGTGTGSGGSGSAARTHAGDEDEDMGRAVGVSSGTQSDRKGGQYSNSSKTAPGQQQQQQQRPGHGKGQGHGQGGKWGAASAAAAAAAEQSSAAALDASVGAVILRMFPGTSGPVLLSKLSRPLALDTRRQLTSLSRIERTAKDRATKGERMNRKRSRAELERSLAQSAEPAAKRARVADGTSFAAAPAAAPSVPAAPVPSFPFGGGSGLLGLVQHAASKASQQQKGEIIIQSTAPVEAVAMEDDEEQSAVAARAPEVSLRTLRLHRRSSTRNAASVKKQKLPLDHGVRTLVQAQDLYARWKDAAYKATVAGSAAGSSSAGGASAGPSSSSASASAGGTVVLADIAAALKAEKDSMKNKEKSKAKQDKAAVAAAAAIAALPASLATPLLLRGVSEHSLLGLGFVGAWANVTRCSQVHARGQAGFISWVGEKNFALLIPIKTGTGSDARASVQGQGQGQGQAKAQGQQQQEPEELRLIVVQKEGTWLAIHWPTCLVAGRAALQARDGRTALVELAASRLPPQFA
jgi:hypothetical protein